MGRSSTQTRRGVRGRLRPRARRRSTRCSHPRSRRSRSSSPLLRVPSGVETRARAAEAQRAGCGRLEGAAVRRRRPHRSPSQLQLHRRLMLMLRLHVLPPRPHKPHPRTRLPRRPPRRRARRRGLARWRAPCSITSTSGSWWRRGRLRAGPAGRVGEREGLDGMRSTPGSHPSRRSGKKKWSKRGVHGAHQKSIAAVCARVCARANDRRCVRVK